MADGELFGVNDMAPWAKKGVKKIITPERLKEVQALLEKKDGRGAAQILRDMNEGLEKFEKSISNKDTADCVRSPVKTAKRDR